MALYFLMTAMFLTMALLVAVNASLTSFNVLPWFNGLRWLRVHLITLGALTESLFGLLPVLVARGRGQPQPDFRWDIWLALNLGLLTLLVAIPIVNQPLILTGGTLIFIATALLLGQLRQMRRSTSSPGGSGIGRNFYLAGLFYFLLGITAGTGLWLGWSEWLQMKTPVEVHIHANNWGFLSLVFAGLLLEMVPAWTGRSVAWPRSISPIFWLMSAGALGLVAGPWVQSLWFTVPGIVLHLSATLWLLLNLLVPLLGERKAWSAPGLWHLLTAYFWIVAPVLVAPLILLGAPGFPGAGIEQNAPQALIYGWVLQFGYAAVPYFFSRVFLPDEPAGLGGSWFSLAAGHLGGIFLWASIFIMPYQEMLHGTAYALWSLSLLPILLGLWRTMRRGLVRLDGTPAASPGERPV